ncbi:helix-turn-helix domain-containing protein [Desmospora profundinema]|uniref:Tetratricopeptide (TPR) repeat protein n=1 Tax=Desmospora profundinema TaxID=1571184 RepID=A0ABU1IM97_9BACL|nr:tetratricopeptide repeat protein [Desmospora profundinema]MDR6225896.1 tetratricopeptide (TPR) repeat protein [Desmospora profundinema]
MIDFHPPPNGKEGFFIGLGNNLRRRRKELGLTQAELAEGIISIPYLSLIENEKAIPRPDVLELLAQRLQCSVNLLIGVTDLETRRRAEIWIDQVQLALSYDGIKKAEQIFFSLVELSRSIADTKILIQVELLEVQLLIYKLEFKESECRLSAIEERWPQLSDEPNLKIWYLRLQGNLYFFKDQYRKALARYREAERILPSVTDGIEKAYVYGNMGRTYLQLSNSSLGILYTEKAIEVLKQNDRWLETCPLLTVLGICHSRSRDYQEAIDCFERVLRMIERFSLSESLASNTYHELGVCHLALGDYDRSIQLLLKSLDVAKEGQLSQWEIGYSHQIICRNYIKKGDLDQARKHLELAMSLLQKRRHRLTDCYIYLGQIHYIEGEMQSFIECYEKAIQEYSHLGISEKAAQVAHTLGKYFNLEKDRDQALSYLLQAVEHYHTTTSTIDIEMELPTLDNQAENTATST